MEEVKDQVKKLNRLFSGMDHGKECVDERCRVLRANTDVQALYETIKYNMNGFPIYVVAKTFGEKYKLKKVLEILQREYPERRSGIFEVSKEGALWRRLKLLELLPSLSQKDLYRLAYEVAGKVKSIAVINSLEETSLIRQLNYFSKSNPVVKDVFFSSTDVLIMKVQDEKSEYYMRVASNYKSKLRQRNQYHVLGELSQNGGVLCPTPIEKLVTDDVEVYLETKLPGNNRTLGGTIGISDEMSLYNEALAWLMEFQNEYSVVTKLTNKRLDSIFKKRYSLFLSRAGEEAVDIVNRLYESIVAELDGMKQLVGVTHGDFKVENCLFGDDGKISGVIDWDMSDLGGLSLMDFSSLFGNTVRSVLKYSLPQVLMDDARLPGMLIESCKFYCREMNVSELSMFLILKIYYLDKVLNQYAYSSIETDEWEVKNILVLSSQPFVFWNRE